MSTLIYDGVAFEFINMSILISGILIISVIISSSVDEVKNNISRNYHFQYVMKRYLNYNAFTYIEN